MYAPNRTCKVEVSLKSTQLRCTIKCLKQINVEHIYLIHWFHRMLDVIVELNEVWHGWPTFHKTVLFWGQHLLHVGGQTLINKWFKELNKCGFYRSSRIILHDVLLSLLKYEHQMRYLFLLMLSFHVILIRNVVKQSFSSRNFLSIHRFNIVLRIQSINSWWTLNIIQNIKHVKKNSATVRRKMCSWCFTVLPTSLLHYKVFRSLHSLASHFCLVDQK